jgi:uncharacterized repeat protein (TIGR03803 family)
MYKPTRHVPMLTMLSMLLLIVARPAQGQSETVLYAFCPDGGSCPNGSSPAAGLTPDGQGNLYGTTLAGGDEKSGAGTVFELSPNGSGGWNYSVLYVFCTKDVDECPDGSAPRSALIIDSAGNLYGTAAGLLNQQNGVVFELSPSGPSWTETVLYRFCYYGKNCIDGAVPNGLVFGRAGNLYGITSSGGANGYGTVFELSPTRFGKWKEQVIYSFPTLSYTPAGLTMDGSGHIFVVNYDQVYELSSSGGGIWNVTVIHTFTGYPKDGIQAMSAPVLDKAGNLYGTTYLGGKYDYGAVYKLSRGKEGRWEERILYSFKGSFPPKKDGNNPSGGLALDAAGNIYGTTTAGGKLGFGTVFELEFQVGKSWYKKEILWSFDNDDGEDPLGGLILDSGNIYGTTFSGDGFGVAFEVTP